MRSLPYRRISKNASSPSTPCQKEIVKTIVDKAADYVLGLKGNQETFHDDVKL